MLEATTYINKEDKRMSHFVGIGLVLGFVLPHSSTALLLVNPLLCLFYQCFRQNRGFYKYNWIVLVPIIITFFINLPQGVSSKAMISCITILLYFSCFPMVGRVRIPNGYFYFILGFIFVTQLAYAFNLTFFERILNTYYPVSEKDFAELYMQENITESNILNYRLGGLYHNSNHASKYLTFLLAAFVILNNEKPFKKLLPFVVVTYISILLTGSRTGFVVASLVILAYIYTDKQISSFWETIIVLTALAAFIMLMLKGSNSFRGINVIEGFSNSANAKMRTFAYYLSSENSILKLLLGYLDTARFNTLDATIHVMMYFDSDYGDLVFCYGFIGFIAILLYFFTIFIKLKREMRLFFVLVLWMYSSTVVTSYRAFFIFMLLLSVLYSNKESYIQK